MIGCVQFQALIDSGAMVNTLTPSVHQEIKRKCWFSIKNLTIHPEETLKAYASNVPLQVLCSFDAFVETIQNSIFSKFFVVNGSTISLMGYQTSVQLGLLKIGIEASSLNITDYSLNNIVSEFPKIPLEPMKFRVKENIVTKQIIRFNISIAFENETNERLGKMENMGIIERADRDEHKISFVSPLVIVPKGNNDFRIVVDYRVNDYISVSWIYLMLFSMRNSMKTLNM